MIYILIDKIYKYLPQNAVLQKFLGAITIFAVRIIVVIYSTTNSKIDFIRKQQNSEAYHYTLRCFIPIFHNICTASLQILPHLCHIQICRNLIYDPLAVHMEDLLLLHVHGDKGGKQKETQKHPRTEGAFAPRSLFPVEAVVGAAVPWMDCRGRKAVAVALPCLL